MGLCQWDRAVPGLSLHRAESPVLMAELCLARGSAVPGEGTGGLCWRAVVFWALQEVVPILCKLRLGSACAVTSPSSVRGAGHLWLISCCQHLRAWIPYRNGDLHSYNVGPLSCLQPSGITTMSQLLGTARAAPSQAGTLTPSPSTQVWPPARPGWGQEEISGCRKGGEGPHDLEP